MSVDIIKASYGIATSPKDAMDTATAQASTVTDSGVTVTKYHDDTTITGTDPIAVGNVVDEARAEAEAIGLIPKSEPQSSLQSDSKPEDQTHDQTQPGSGTNITSTTEDDDGDYLPDIEDVPSNIKDDSSDTRLDDSSDTQDDTPATAKVTDGDGITEVVYRKALKERLRPSTMSQFAKSAIGAATPSKSLPKDNSETGFQVVVGKKKSPAKGKRGNPRGGKKGSNKNAYKAKKMQSGSSVSDAKEASSPSGKNNPTSRSGPLKDNRFASLSPPDDTQEAPDFR